MENWNRVTPLKQKQGLDSFLKTLTCNGNPAMLV